MPIQITSNLIPKSGQRFFLLEDRYFKGGYRVVANVADRDLIVTDSQLATGLKIGMLVMTSDTFTTWRYNGGSSWTEYKPNQLYTHVQESLSQMWVVTHNKNCLHFVYSAFDDQGYNVIPDSCRRIDANTIELGFSTPVSGSVTFSFNLS